MIGAGGSREPSQKRRHPNGEGEENFLDITIEHSQRVTEELIKLRNAIIEKDRAMGGTGDLTAPSAESMRDVLEFNVAGETVRARRSTLCAAKGSVLALMFCGKFDAAFIRDEKNRIFIQCYGPAFKWLVGELIMYEGEQIENVALPASKQKDAAFTYWVELLMYIPSTKRRANYTAPPPPSQGHNQPQPAPQPYQHPPPPAHHQPQPQPQPQQLLQGLVNAIRMLIPLAFDDMAAQLERLEAIRPLLKSGNAEEDSLVSIDVSGSAVTVTKAVATSLGDDSTFANRFLKYDPLTVDVAPEYVQRVVNVVARAFMKRTTVKALDVQRAVGESDIKGFRHALTMYGLHDVRYMGPVDGLLENEHLQKMRQWCEKYSEAPAIPPCVGEPVIRIYKATMDGWRWLHLLYAVKGHSPLLIIFKVADSNELFASLIEGPIEVTGPAASRPGIKSHAFKLQGTESHPYVGALGWADKLNIAGTQVVVEDIFDPRAPENRERDRYTRDLSAVLRAAGTFDFGTRRADQWQTAPPASDETLKSCQGNTTHKCEPADWHQWDRPSVHSWDYYCSGDHRDYPFWYPVSIKGWQFELAELEAYRLGGA
ncbi:unnamed protein product [Vitrella brassicaformis CCMP3155]|uniref:BTB domain-containing protein n=1 Tax=Vitrella brassicaformis (strain CCMP3155) TaxID=1169540 RepID=A0A0G4H1B0_VITBC|nr:unnamed protein product [Vitrella brassicaformis CCMP3155]|eukprot:CEM37382.1 unnamed protein product [Vitrella brassicaformis CCMP3155]